MENKNNLTKEEQKLKEQQEKLNLKKKQLNKKRREIQRRKNNIRLFPIYRMVSWDFLFYYPIILLFLTQVKSLDASQVLLADTFYTLFISIFLLFTTYFIDKIGKKRLLVIRNLLLVVTLLGLMVITNFYQLLFIELINALGMAIKTNCEPNLLYESIKTSKKRGNIFSKIDAKASSNFFYLESIASLIAGVTFSINPYIPMVLSLVCSLTALVLSIRFKDITLINEKEKIRLEKFQDFENTKQLQRRLTREYKKRKNVNFIKYMRGLKDVFRNFKISRRLRYLFLLNAIIYGIIYATTNLRSALLTEIELPSYMFGILFAILQLLAGISSRYQNQIHKMFKNKSLTVLSLPIVISMIILGYVVRDRNTVSKYLMIFICFAIPYMAKRPFIGLTHRYLSNFTNSKIRNSITAFKNTTSYIANSIFSAIAAILLVFTDSGNTFIVLGCVCSILTLYTLEKMKKYVGLKPEQYEVFDIMYANDFEKIMKKKELNMYKEKGVVLETEVEE